VSAGDDAACGRALRLSERIIIEDVESDEGYAPYRSVAAAAGYRAVQSTPLMGRDRTPLGMLSTHFQKPHRPSQQDLHRLDLYSRQMAIISNSLTSGNGNRDGLGIFASRTILRFVTMQYVAVPGRKPFPRGPC